MFRLKGLREFGQRTAGVVAALALTAVAAQAQPGSGPNASCQNMPSHQQLQAALVAAVAAEQSGLKNNMWATVVDRDGVVCEVAFTGADRGAQWPGSRVISAQKANTANAFSLPGLALSTANLFTAVQPGGSLFGLQESNPVNVAVAYQGPSQNYGQQNDPITGSKIGGVNVFGGGLALYSKTSGIVGGLGVSGDTSCTDHDTAWRVRHALNLDWFTHVAGVSGDPLRPDNIIYDIMLNPDGTGGTGQNPTGSGGVGMSTGGFGHPRCLNTGNQNALPAVQGVSATGAAH